LAFGGYENRRGRFDKISGRNFGRRRAATLTEPPLDGAKPGGERQSSPLRQFSNARRSILQYAEFGRGLKFFRCYEG
jgi:hypothetical protein